MENVSYYPDIFLVFQPKKYVLNEKNRYYSIHILKNIVVYIQEISFHHLFVKQNDNHTLTYKPGFVISLPFLGITSLFVEQTNIRSIFDDILIAILNYVQHNFHKYDTHISEYLQFYTVRLPRNISLEFTKTSQAKN